MFKQYFEKNNIYKENPSLLDQIHYINGYLESLKINNKSYQQPNEHTASYAVYTKNDQIMSRSIV